MSADPYFDAPGLNWSRLKLIGDSPAHCLQAMTSERKDTPTLAMGRAIHALALEPETFSRDFAIFEGERRAGKVWTDFQSAHEGRTILKVDEADQAAAVAAAVRRHPAVQPYLTGGIFERPIYWTCPATGLHRKSRPDLWHPLKRTLIDLKSTVTTDPRRFASMVARYQYHGQLADYGEAIRADTGRSPDNYVIVAVEKLAPYDVVVYRLGEDWINIGAALAADYADRFLACQRAGAWPGRFTEQVELAIPRWMDSDDDDASDFDLNVGD